MLITEDNASEEVYTQLRLHLVGQSDKEWCCLPKVILLQSTMSKPDGLYFETSEIQHKKC